MLFMVNRRLLAICRIIVLNLNFKHSKKVWIYKDNEFTHAVGNGFFFMLRPYA